MTLIPLIDFLAEFIKVSVDVTKRVNCAKFTQTNAQY